MVDEKANALQDRNQSLADIAHDNHRSTIHVTFQSVIPFSTEALKAAALINGGAAAAILAFIAQTIDKKANLALGLMAPIKSFAWGLIFSAVATGVSYIAQLCFATSPQKQRLTNRHPYVEVTKESENWEDAGIVFQVVAILLVVIAYGLAIRGFFQSADALEAGILK